MKIKANQKFKETRLKKGYTLVNLAEKIEMSKQAIGQVERGINGISPTNSTKVLAALNVEFDEIFEIKE